MNCAPFDYRRATDEADAIASAAGGGTILAGGTNLVDMMRLGVTQPSALIDIQKLPLAAIEVDGGTLTIGALARNSDVAWHPIIEAEFPVLSEAILSGASPQLRNLATVGGNLLQRTRCAYFRDLTFAACNKRNPGSGCAAMDGGNRMHAILGTSAACIASHPSDMCVALVALDAVVHVRGPNGARAIPVVDLHTLPGDRPDIETVLMPGEIVVSVTLPASRFAKRSRYVKVRDRASYAFALVSCAVALEVDAGRIVDARVALGGVGTKPWRSVEAERELVGQAPDRKIFRDAADAALAQGVHPRRDNAFKVELAKRAIVRALDLTASTP